MCGLKVENIYAGYGKKEVLRGVSLNVEKNEIVAIIGPNGAGKSTLLKVIAGFLTPFEGKIILDGNDITRMPPYRRTDMGIAYFMQGGKVFSNLTVRENLEIGIKNNRKIVDDIINIFPDMKNWLNLRAGLLSGGQRQQLAIFMILLKEPQIILLDEPSAGLSPLLAKEIIKKIEEIKRIWKIGIVLVEQNIGEALKISDRVCIMANGQLIRCTDKPQELIESRFLEKVFIGGEEFL